MAAKDIEPMLEAIAAGAYAIEQRILLEASIAGTGHSCLAFNDVVLSKGVSAAWSSTRSSSTASQATRCEPTAWP